MKPGRKWWLWSVAGLVVVGVGVGLLVAKNGRGDGSKKKNGKEGPTAAPVEVAEVRRGEITTYLETTTTLEARNSATLVASRTGQVRALMAEEGRAVKKGAVLAQLDDTEARLAVERAEVALKSAERESERGRQLSGQGFMSGKDIDDLELKRRNAKVTLDEARYNLSQTRLTAPFSGQVTARMINLGETVTSGRECFRLEDFDPLLARLYFPEREVARLKVGQAARLTLDALPGREFEARVALVNPVVDRANGTVKVTLEVRDPSRVLRPGNFAKVQLRTGSFNDAVVLPRRAMLSEDGESYVFVARGDTVIKRTITVGAISGDTAQIIAGLAAGDSVVTVGQGGLKQGARIKPVRL
jgi:RND family efflux transporter MFP subunit